MYIYTCVCVNVCSRQNPLQLSSCNCRFFGGYIAFQCFVPLSLLGGLSLCSVSCTSLTKVLLQYYIGFNHFDRDTHSHTIFDIIYAIIWQCVKTLYPW